MKGTTTYIVEEFLYGGELIILELDIVYDVSRFIPSSWMDPAEGGEIEECLIKVTLVTIDDHVIGCENSLVDYQLAFDKFYDEDSTLQEKIAEKIYESAADRESDDIYDYDYTMD